MLRPSLVLTLLLCAGAAAAQDAVPDLRGTWSGTARSVVIGSGFHHPGAEAQTSPPRIREVEFTYRIEGQDGRLVWGRTISPSFEEPFAWAIAEDGRTLVGADLDGQYRLTILSPDTLENCYAHSALSPTKSIVASCFTVERRR